MRALAVNPGLIPGTDLTRYLGAEELEQMTQSAIPEHLVFKTVSQGTSSTIWAAVAPELEGIGGVYIDDAAIADVIEPTVAPGQVEQGVLSYALDEKIAERLWSLSEEWSREVFPA